MPETFHINPETLDFNLPESLIAQEPPRVRDQARLLVLSRTTGKIEHRRFADLAEYLNAGDVLVINKAKVSRAKLIGKKPTGGKVEAIFLNKELPPNQWRALVRPLLKDGTRFDLPGGVTATVSGRAADGEYLLNITGDIDAVLEREGQVPLPPYIKRDASDPRTAADQANYQTVFASVAGSVAAPTAGLHFSPELLQRLRDKGVIVVEILLHVGWGTFRPIVNRVDEHAMLSEHYEVSAAAHAELTRAKAEKRRIVAVGTTSTRTIESMKGPGPDATALFIKPGFQFRWVDALVTNLHVPKSTPVSLTAAFAGLTNLEHAYAEAINSGYRFFSYGDAMLIL